MKVIWKAPLRFGQVAIPVGLAAAREQDGGYFRRIHKDCLQPVSLRNVCPEHGELEPDQVGKGIEVSPGQYELFEEEPDTQDHPREFEILRLVREPVDAIYFDRTYYLAPTGADSTAYALFVRTLEELELGAIVRFHLWRKTNVAYVRAREEALVLHTLFHAADVRSTAEILDALATADIGEKELKLSKQLARRLIQPWNPSELEVTPRAERGLAAAEKVGGTGSEDLSKTLRRTLRQQPPSRRSRAKARS